MTTTKHDKRREKVDAARAATVAPIIAAIEQGIADPDNWSMPWHAAPASALLPHCPATSYDYTGGNRMALALVSMMTGAANHWGTYKQWRDMSRHATECNRTAENVGKRNEKRPDCGDACHIVNVRRGEKASAAILRPATVKQRDENGATIVKPDGTEATKIIGWNAHPVWHAHQVDGYEMPRIEQPDRRPADDVADIDAAYRFAAAIGARVEESGTAGASYSPTLDRIQMPDRDRFTSAHGAWSTMTHELTHWTGHASRLNRDMSGRFGDNAYAAEELVAEMGAAFTLAAIGRSSEPRPDHAQYLAHWLGILKADPAHLWTVASKAEAASGYLVERAEVLPESVGV